MIVKSNHNDCGILITISEIRKHMKLPLPEIYQISPLRLALGLVLLYGPLAPGKPASDSTEICYRVKPCYVIYAVS